MNRHIRHEMKGEHGIHNDVQGGNYIYHNDAPFRNDSKTGGRTMAFHVYLRRNITAPTQGGNLIQARDSSNNATGLFNMGIVRISGETSNQQRMSITTYPSTKNVICYSSGQVPHNNEYLLIYQTTGSVYKMWIDGVEQTVIEAININLKGNNNGDWFGYDTSSKENVTFGSNTLESGGWCESDIYHVAYWDKQLTSDEIAEYWNSGDVKDPRHIYSAIDDLSYYIPAGEIENAENSVSTIYEVMNADNPDGVGLSTGDIVSH